MGLVSFVLTLPLAPMRGVIGLAQVLERRANEELYDPARVRRRLEEIEEDLASGTIGREEAEWAQKQVLAPVVATSAGPPAAVGSDSGASGEPGSGGSGKPEATGSDFVTVRSDDEDDDRDATGGDDEGRDATGNDFVTLRGDDSDPGPET